jgi:hypothetical protein
MSEKVPLPWGVNPRAGVVCVILFQRVSSAFLARFQRFTNDALALGTFP